MADLTYTATMGDKGVRSGLRDFERDASRAAQRSSQAFDTLGKASGNAFGSMIKGAAAFIGVNNAAQLAARSLEMYAQRNVDAASSLEKLAKARDAFLVDIGRDLTSFLPDIQDWIDKARGAYNGLTTQLAYAGKILANPMDQIKSRGLSGQVAAMEIDAGIAALKKSEGMQREFAAATDLGTAALENQEKIARLNNETLAADELRARIEFQKEFQRIAAEGKAQNRPMDWFSTKQGYARNAFDAQMAKAKRDEEKRQDDERAKAAADAAAYDRAREAESEKRANAVAEMELERQRLALTHERLDLTDVEIAKREKGLKLAEYLNKLDKMEGLNSSEKSLLASDARIASAAELVGELEKSGKKKNDVARTAIQAGASVIGTARTAGLYQSSATPGLAEAKQALQEAIKQSKSLINIEKAVAETAKNSRRNVAVFAP